MKPPITYYGGKQQLAETIVNMMPAHRLYVEPFFGGGAVFFAKPKSYLEVVNDINDRLITFYQVAQTRFDELEQLISTTLCAESMYMHAKDVYNGRVEASDVELAWSVWLITNGSFSGSMHGGWKSCNGTSGSHTGVYLQNKRNDFNLRLRDRLSTVQISCRDALGIITQRDSVDTLFYLDPPYPCCAQGHYKGYDMKDFAQLLELLATIKGKFILSNYWCQTLRFHVATNGWNVYKHTLPMKVCNFGKPRSKEEIIITNYNEVTLFDYAYENPE